MPAVVAMTVNMLRRVPAGVEQPSRSAPVRFFLDRFKIGQLSAGSADRSGALWSNLHLRQSNGRLMGRSRHPNVRVTRRTN